MSRKVSIHSDGSAVGTVILDEDGKKITEVGHASIEVDAREGVSVTLELGPSSINIQGTVATSVFECGLCNQSFEHECDTRLGGGPGGFLPNQMPFIRCESRLIERDPHGVHECIREVNHDKNHFDGEVVWL